MLTVAKGRKAASMRRGGAPVLLVSAVVVPLIAAGIYWTLGSPETPSLPFAERADERAEDTEIANLTNRLRTFAASALTTVSQSLSTATV